MADHDEFAFAFIVLRWAVAAALLAWMVFQWVTQ